MNHATACHAVLKALRAIEIVANKNQTNAKKVFDTCHEKHVALYEAWKVANPWRAVDYHSPEARAEEIARNAVVEQFRKETMLDEARAHWSKARTAAEKATADRRRAEVLDHMLTYSANGPFQNLEKYTQVVVTPKGAEIVRLVGKDRYNFAAVRADGSVIGASGTERGALNLTSAYGQPVGFALALIRIPRIK